jgi:hypothetical protein
MHEAARTWRIEPVLRLPYNVGKVGVVSTTDLVISDPIDVSDALDGWLLVDVHENALAAAELVEVVVEGLAPSDDEPETTFVATPTLAFTRVQPSDAAGTLRSARLSWRLPSHVRVALRLVQEKAGATPTVRPVKVSVALLVQGWGAAGARAGGCECTSAK